MWLSYESGGLYIAGCQALGQVPPQLFERRMAGKRRKTPLNNGGVMWLRLERVASTN